MNYKIWKTKQGEKIHIEKMTDFHLQSSINLIIRLNWRTEWINHLRAEQNRRKNLSLSKSLYPIY